MDLEFINHLTLISSHGCLALGERRKWRGEEEMEENDGTKEEMEDAHFSLFQALYIYIYI